MRKFGLIAAVLGVVLVPLFLFVSVANAQSFKSGDNITVGKDETVDSAMWAAGRNIDIAGTVDGDLWCAGQNVVITGEVNGDVLCMAQTIQIDGIVEGDLRLAAQTIRIGATVLGNASVAAQTVSIGDKARVAGDVQVAATDVVLHGRIGRDIGVVAENAIINGAVGRDVNAQIDNLEVRKVARVGGNLYYTSNNLVNVERGATVDGDMIRTAPDKDDSSDFEIPYFFGLGVMAALYGVFALLLLAVVLFVLLPGVFKEISDTALASPLKVLLVGLFATISFPVVFAILVVSLAGVPLAILMLFAWLVILMLAGPFFAYYFGRLIFKDQYHPVLIMTASSLLILLSFFIPVIGILIMIVAIWMGVGMILTTVYTHRWHHPARIAELHQATKKTVAPSKVNNKNTKSTGNNHNQNAKKRSNNSKK